MSTVAYEITRQIGAGTAVLREGATVEEVAVRVMNDARKVCIDVVLVGSVIRIHASGVFSFRVVRNIDGSLGLRGTS